MTENPLVGTIRAIIADELLGSGVDINDPFGDKREELSDLLAERVAAQFRAVGYYSESHKPSLIGSRRRRPGTYYESVAFVVVPTTGDEK